MDWESLGMLFWQKRQERCLSLGKVSQLTGVSTDRLAGIEAGETPIRRDELVYLLLFEVRIGRYYHGLEDH